MWCTNSRPLWVLPLSRESWLCVNVDDTAVQAALTLWKSGQNTQHQTHLSLPTARRPCHLRRRTVIRTLAVISFCHVHLVYVLTSFCEYSPIVCHFPDPESHLNEAAQSDFLPFWLKLHHRLCTEIKHLRTCFGQSVEQHQSAATLAIFSTKPK